MDRKIEYGSEFLSAGKLKCKILLTRCERGWNDIKLEKFMTLLNQQGSMLGGSKKEKKKLNKTVETDFEA
jgi:hypothetical protein